MDRSSTGILKGAALGLAAAAAAGAAAARLAGENRHELKKVVRKAEKGALRALDRIESGRR